MAIAMTLTEQRYYNFIDAIDAVLRKDKLHGAWVSKRSSYERELCAVLNWKFVNVSDHDAISDGFQIEIKKAQHSLWFDLRKFVDAAAYSDNHVVVVFVYKRHRDYIDDFLVIPTKRICEKLCGGEDDAQKRCADALKTIQQRVPRQFNAMTSLSLVDLRKLAI